MEIDKHIGERIIKLEQQIKSRFIEIHNLIIEKTGGELGIRSESTLDFIIYNLVQDTVIKRLKPIDVAANCLIFISTRHPFSDGNKRSALILSEISYNLAYAAENKATTLKPPEKTLLVLKQPEYAEIENEIILIAAKEKTKDDAKKLLTRLFCP
ncbi:MAG: Fic family protein [Candidatus ainarchaeum sp.]|nr:Fic family protein [Candidatus ainarchaeum sp.]